VLSTTPTPPPATSEPGGQVADAPATAVCGVAFGSVGSGGAGGTPPAALMYVILSRPAAAPACVAFVALAADETPPSDDILMSAPVIDPFLIFAPVTASRAMWTVRTAPVRICLAPTLFAGSRVTAYELPPIATNR